MPFLEDLLPIDHRWILYELWLILEPLFNPPQTLLNEWEESIFKTSAPILRVARSQGHASCLSFWAGLFVFRVFAWKHPVIKIFILIRGKPHQAQARNIAFLIHLTIPAYGETRAQLCKCQAPYWNGFYIQEVSGLPRLRDSTFIATALPQTMNQQSALKAGFICSEEDWSSHHTTFLGYNLGECFLFQFSKNTTLVQGETQP